VGSEGGVRQECKINELPTATTTRFAKKKTGGKIDAFQTRDSAYKHCFFPSCVCVVVGVFVFASFLLANTGLF